MGNLRAKCFPRFERQCKRKQRRAKSSTNNNRPNMCNKQPPPSAAPPPPPTTNRGTISFIPCQEQNLFAEQREKPTTSKGRSSTRERVTNEPFALGRWCCCCCLCSRLALTLFLCLSVRACAEHETQSTQPTQPARAAIKAEVTGDESNILNATVVKYTPRSQLRTFVHLLDVATNNTSSPWQPNTNSPKPTNTAK